MRSNGRSIITTVALRHCQAQRPEEDVTEWVRYFLSALVNVQKKLANKVERSEIKGGMSPREKTIYEYVANNAGCKSNEIAEELSIANPTIKRILSDMVERDLLERYGKGAGTNYTIR